MVPKLYAIDRAERVARRIARPLQSFRVLFHPFIVVLTVTSNAMLERARGRPDAAHLARRVPGRAQAADPRSEAGGMLEANEATMLSGVFHLHEQEARQVMTPIPAVVTVDLSEDVETALRRCIDSGHTRLLVTEDENPDRIRGVVHATGLARRLLDKGPHASIEPLVRDVPIVPETKPLDDLLAELQRQRTALAVVADEYGRVVGIVTVEDIVEEVVGEITDETDAVAGDVRQLPSGDWFVRGHVPVADLADYGIDLPSERGLQLDRRARVQRPGPAPQARRQGRRRRLRVARRVGAREPDRARARTPAPRARGGLGGGRGARSDSARRLPFNGPTPRGCGASGTAGRRCGCEICVAGGSMRRTNQGDLKGVIELRQRSRAPSATRRSRSRSGIAVGRPSVLS